jgi:hypothetical protein
MDQLPETTPGRPALCFAISFVAVYIARVRITVQVDGSTIVREGHGTGEGRGASPGEVHDIVLKAAETDATKRALATFGKPFGLELYRGGKTASAQSQSALKPSLSSPPIQPRVGLHPDDTTPIPRPSHYYGRRHHSSTKEFFRNARASTERNVPVAPPLPEPTAPNPVPGRIDKSQLAIAEPKRLRDKAHLKFVASQPCAVCGRKPSDPHHLRFAQPRAIGLKVSGGLEIISSGGGSPFALTDRLPSMLVNLLNRCFRSAHDWPYAGSAFWCGAPSRRIRHYQQRQTP